MLNFDLLGPYLKLGGVRVELAVVPRNYLAVAA